MRKVLLTVSVVLLAGVAGVAALAYSGRGGSLHELAHEVGLCCARSCPLAGAELARCGAERADDGKVFEAWTAPGFTLPSTSGGTVSLSGHRGRPVALVFLAGHCDHCLRTLPLLAARGRRLAAAYGFRMVPTTFLIDRQGRVTRKLAGMKDGKALREAFDDLVGS